MTSYRGATASTCSVSCVRARSPCCCASASCWCGLMPRNDAKPACARAGSHAMASVEVAEHFADAAQQRSAMRLGMWTFVAQEVLFFGGLFLVYAVMRLWYPHTFLTAHERLSEIAG